MFSKSLGHFLPIVPRRKRLNGTTILFIFLASQIVYGQYVAPTPPPIVNAVTLELNKPVKREMSGKPRHNYKIALAAKQYVKIILEQRGIDIGARIYGTDDKQIFDVDGDFRLDKPEIIEFVPPVAGAYRLDVINKYPLAPPGEYEIRIVEMRPATEGEILQQQARSLYGESQRQIIAGKYAEAATAAEKAFGIDRKEFGAESLTVVTDLNQLARIAEIKGEYERAIEFGEQALTAREKSAEPDHYRFGIALYQLGNNHGWLKNYPQSIEYYRQAIAIFTASLGASNPTIAAVLINLGENYSSLGDDAKALENYERALAIQEKSARENEYNTASVLNDIGAIYTARRDYAKAEIVLLRAVKILETLYQAGSPRTIEALSALAVCYTQMREFDKAEEIFGRVAAIGEKSLAPDHPSIAANDFNLGNLYALKNDFEKAEKFFRRALEIREKNFGADGAPLSEILIALAPLVARRGDVAEALKLQQKANAIDERSISLNLTVGSERQKSAYLGSLFDHTNQSIYLHAKYAPDDAFAVELAATTVLRQKGRVLDAAADNLTALRRRLDLRDAELLDKFNKITGQIAPLILKGAEDAPLAEYQLKIKVLTDERESIEDEISRRAAGYFSKSQPVTLPAIQAVIPPDAALIEFVVYQPSSFTDEQSSAAKQRYAAYVLHNQDKVEWKDLGDAAEIDDLIDAWRQSLRDRKRTDVRQLARRADERIMQPLRALVGDAEHLLVAPDGELNLIPFEALVDERNRFLIENYSFTYLTSGRDLLRINRTQESKSKPLLIANPQFGETAAGRTIAAVKTGKTPAAGGGRRSVTAARNMSDTYFAPLGATVFEARSIQNLFPDATILSGAQATEAALNQATAPQILHIATHGFFLENTSVEKSAEAKTADRSSNASGKIENPLVRSGLALAGANRRAETGGDDGIFTALEASGLNLWGTKLVVLSACDTGLGEIRNGEGVYGLRRAFVLAGAESLVMSLWSVSDYATREMMDGYYGNLKNGAGRGAALRGAQLAMMKRKGRSHPFYWAGFIQSGEWANLDGRR